jgi:hypothetical protein
LKYCPICGSEVEPGARFCPNCGASQVPVTRGPITQPPQAARITTGHQYDEAICFMICCCLSPLAALIYYRLTEHPEKTARYDG